MSIAMQVRHSVEAGLLLLGMSVLLGPILVERLRIPGMIGLIGLGTVLGPHALEWLQPGGFVATLGAAGLLYLMFVAGLELDLGAFVANRRSALGFGLLTFAVPFGLSWIVGRHVLGLGIAATALIGAMWASHTVVAYPEVKAAGIDRHRSVGVSMAATVITDVAALIVLAVAASSAALSEAPEVAAQLASGSIETSTTVPLWFGLTLMLVVCFGVIPRLTRWLFANVLLRRSQRFVWAIVAMAAGAIAGLAGGIEGLVGAFLAGIGMNSSVPARGELMERIEFIGSSLLVPAFLVSVGLAIDPLALVDPETLGIAAVFTATVVIGKVGAALGSGLLGRFTRAEIALMASLTIGQAAATLAIAQVGVTSGLLDEQIRDAAVVTVAITVVVSSLGSRIAARRVAQSGRGAMSDGEHVLVLAPVDAVPLARFAALASAIVRDGGGLVTPFAVRAAGADAAATADRLGALDDALVRLGRDTRPIHRVADTLGNGVAQLADEIGATLLVSAVSHRHLDAAITDGGFAPDVPEVPGVTTVRLAPIDGPVGDVVLVTGRVDGAPDRAGRGADLARAAELAAAFAAGRSLTVVAPDDEPFPAARGVVVVGVAHDGDAAAAASEHVRPGDLLVVPAHVLADAGEHARAALADVLTGVSVVVVGGRARRGRRRTSTRIPAARRRSDAVATVA